MRVGVRHGVLRNALQMHRNPRNAGGSKNLAIESVTIPKRLLGYLSQSAEARAEISGLKFGGRSASPLSTAKNYCSGGVLSLDVTDEGTTVAQVLSSKF